ncbi:MAG: M14 family zinc carboxypeptidase [Planctomycetota bacterium]
MRPLHCVLLGSAAFVNAFAATAPGQSQSPAPAQPVRQLIEVTTIGPAQMQQLLAMDLDLAGCRLPLPAQRRVEVVALPGDLARLQQAGLHCRVLVDDMQAAHAAALAAFPVAAPDALTPPIGQGAMGGHYTLAQMEAILDAMHLANPQICSPRISIGQSLEGRDLWMVKISDNVGVDENEPEVLYDAVHHAREPLSMSTTLLFMDELLAGYGTDPEATFLIDERELFFVPCVNPDGYEYNRQSNPNGGGLWRKNRRNNGGSFGVDLNRNYATQWSAPNGGSSSTPSSETYRGTAPFSEPEVAVMEAFSAGRQFVAVFSSHSYTDVLLRPWAYQLADPSNVAAYQKLGAFMVQENGIAHGQWGTLLYIASGTAVDHHHVARGSYAWTAELGRSNEGGFWPVGPNIEAIARRHQRMFRKVALTAGAAFALAARTVTEGPGANGNLVVEPGESGQVVVDVENLGAAAGPLTVQLLAVDPQIVIGNGVMALGSVAAFAHASNTAMPLTFAVPAGFAGSVAHLRLRLSGDGRTQDQALDVPVAPPRRCIDDDFEQDRGFARASLGTATGGLWERSAPQATSLSGVPMQPGVQTTPGGSRCQVTDGRAGATANTYDVDDGYTDLRSPRLDLSHLEAVSVAFDLWYAESSGDDPLLVQWSRDGGANWSLLYSRSTSTNSWQRVELPLAAPLTQEVVLRVRAQDLFASTVEACIDGFELRAAARDGAMTLLGSGVLGTNLRIGMNGPNGALLLPVTALGLGPGLSAPGIGGTFLLDLATVALMPLQVFGSSGYAAIDLALPVQAGLVGVPIAFQSVLVTTGGIAFGGNAPSVTMQ